MCAANKPLPEFDNPPVIETALGVEFAPLSKWAIPHFGLYWAEIKNEYPHFEVQPPIASQIEKLGKPAKSPPLVTFELISQPTVRCWFIHKSHTRLLQIQNDRFVHNWRKVGPAANYPHYESIRPIFAEEWNRFCGFLETWGIGVPDVKQCEVTYVNHIDVGQGWKTLADLPDVMGTRIGASTDNFLPPPETVNLVASYGMPAEQGRLHVQLLPVIRHADAAESLQLTIIARGRPASSAIADLLQWLDLGREWVVRGFADFTSGTIQGLWQRR